MLQSPRLRLPKSLKVLSLRVEVEIGTSSKDKSRIRCMLTPVSIHTVWKDLLCKAWNWLLRRELWCPWGGIISQNLEKALHIFELKNGTWSKNREVPNCVFGLLSTFCHLIVLKSEVGGEDQICKKWVSAFWFICALTVLGELRVG